MERKFIVGVDFGSTHAVARVYSQELNVICSAFTEVHKMTGTDGSREMDPESVWQCFCLLLRELLRCECTLHVFNLFDSASEIDPKRIMCFGLSVQRNSLLLWDRKTGIPRSKIITWQDLCSSTVAERLNNSFKFRVAKAASKVVSWTFRVARFKTFAAFNFRPILACVRLKYLMDRSLELRRDCDRGLVCYGCLETWLLWRLTGGASFCTDMSCASVTGMYDIYQRKWSIPVLNLLGIPKTILPAVHNSSHHFGCITAGPLKMDSSNESGPGGGGGFQTSASIPITAVIGDAQASSISENCSAYGQAKLTLGTGTFFNVSSGGSPKSIAGSLYPVIGWASSRNENGEDGTSDCVYLLEGSHCNTGTLLEWLRSEGVFESYDELTELLTEGDNYGLDEKARGQSAFYLPVPSKCSEEQRQLWLDRQRKWGGETQRRSIGGDSSCPSSASPGVAAAADVSNQPVVGPDGILVGVDFRSKSAAAGERNSRSLIARLVVESIAYISCELVEQSASLDLLPTVLRVNGNVSRSDWLMQRLADVTGIRVERSPFDEASCLGTAIAAGVGAGVWPSFSAATKVLHSLPDFRNGSRAFSPHPVHTGVVRRRYLAWSAARARFFDDFVK